jgi:iron-sulfur cluster assembly protein
MSTDTAPAATQAPAQVLPLVQLTDKAAGEVKRILAEKSMSERTGLRISLKGGGCSGMTYVLDFAEEGQANDTELESQGIRLLVDETAVPFLQGLQIDFVDDLLNRGFKFENPNAAHSCGCGTSFSV